ncbi:MAG: response regulator [Alphaproteobacteria bacterium]
MARVMLVDDHDNLRASIALLFKSNGHQVTACRDFKSAVEALEKQKKPVDLLLSDWNYPGQKADSRAGGFELLRHLVTVAATQPERLPKNVVVMSDDTTKVQTGVTLSGFEQPLPKVFSKSELFKTLYKPVLDMLKR